MIVALYFWGLFFPVQIKIENQPLFYLLGFAKDLYPAG